MGYLSLKGLKKFFGVDPLKELMNWLNEPATAQDQLSWEICLKPSKPAPRLASDAKIQSGSFVRQRQVSFRLIR
jgi:hypothetical protein